MFGLLWAVLLGAGGVLEVVALRRKAPGDTLSEQVWRLTRPSLRRAPWWVQSARGVVLLVTLWLAGHFTFGWWTL